ncbi:metallophosphoesterase family protein [Pseudomonas rossensis]|uniref:metallophosphoesterase family protein n=1 Tax=Pseudomonas rossensis TaxID=2305471 RepID=UPI003260394D
MPTTTIMHLSDLHRDAESRIRTATLLSSLGRDMDRYTANEGIPKPDLAVISGDIVYGVRGSDTDGDAQLAKQYDEAYETLTGLADRFFGGDRERVILVPGNHDISMPHVSRALVPVAMPEDAEGKKKLARELMEPESTLRLNLDAFEVLRIANLTLYNQRLEPYAKFYERFYNGGRKFSLVPEEQYSTHDFPKLGVCIVGFSSCHDNDLYNRTGHISVEAITRAMDEANPIVKDGRLIIGVWHHSIQGGPKENDYIESGFLRHLMDANCSIGMHGHQHRPELLENRFSADSHRHISVISAGTLCGGPHSLPSGRMRAYNLVVLDQDEGVGTIHVRAMTNSDFSSPIWERGHVAEFGGSSMKFKLAQRKAQGRSAFDAAGKADQLIHQGLPVDAFELVRMHLSDPWARQIAATALAASENWKEAINLFSPPSSAADFLLLCDAYEALCDWASLRALISSSFARECPELAVQQRIQISQATLKGK